MNKQLANLDAPRLLAHRSVEYVAQPAGRPVGLLRSSVGCFLSSFDLELSFSVNSFLFFSSLFVVRNFVLCLVCNEQ